MTAAITFVIMKSFWEQLRGDRIRSRVDHSFFRFFLVGGVNTGLTYAIYLFLNLFINYLYAYSAAYVVGIIFSYLLTAGWVFRISLSLVTFFLYPLIYLIQYLVGVFLLDFLVESAGVSESVAPILVIVGTLPITYLLSKALLTRG